MTANEGLKTLQDTFKLSTDIKFATYKFNEQTVHFITCEKMVDNQFLYEIVIPNIEKVMSNWDNSKSFSEQKEKIHLPSFKEIAELKEAELLVYKGFLLLFFEQQQRLFSVNIAKKPNREPQETNSEVTIKGPRDNFIEDLPTNIALVRKRLPTSSLAIEKLTLGKRTKTDIAILYFKDIADQNILKELKSRLSEIDTDIIVSGDLMLERVIDYTSVLPLTDYTGRADYAVQALARGRFIIFIDGVAYANILPINLLLLIKTSEDNDFPAAFSTAERLLRLASLLIGAFLPGLWLALTTFHPNQLPFQLLATVVQANVGSPFPSALEMLLMVFLFELLREAGLRLPSIIGSTIGVVGGLIIGDAAIRAGITSPAMVVIIATSTIATYTLVNQSLVTAVSVIRFVTIIFSSLTGLFGFIIVVFLTLLYLSNIRPFGVSYMNIGADLSWNTISKSLFRLQSKSYKRRPPMLNPKDPTRGEDKK